MARYMKDHVFGSSRFWVDGNDLADTRTFVSFKTGQNLTYTRWAPNEPNGMHGVEHCVEIANRNGIEMNDHLCDRPNFFICEFDAKA